MIFKNHFKNKGNHGNRVPNKEKLLKCEKRELQKILYLRWLCHVHKWASIHLLRVNNPRIIIAMETEILLPIFHVPMETNSVKNLWKRKNIIETISHKNSQSYKNLL